MRAAAKRARPAVYRWVPYVLVVVAASIGAYLSAQQAIERTATIAYWNAVDSCNRGNETAGVTRAAREARDRTYAVECLTIVEKVGPADDYVPPEER